MEPGSPNASSAGAGLRAFDNHDMSDLGFKRFLARGAMARNALNIARQRKRTGPHALPNEPMITEPLPAVTAGGVRRK